MSFFGKVRKRLNNEARGQKRVGRTEDVKTANEHVIRHETRDLT